jgi:hypothetical protein
MNALTKSLAAAAVLTGAMLSAPVHALPTCATAVGMSITPPGGTLRSSSSADCLEISGGYNQPDGLYSFSQKDAFLQLLVDKWGGNANDWLYLREVDGRDDGGDDSIVFNPFHQPDPNESADLWTNPQGAGTPSFSVSITEPGFPLPFVPKVLDVIGVIKPDSIKDPNDPGNVVVVDRVLAYLFSDMQINERGELRGTYDLGSGSTTAPGYLPAGVTLYGRFSGPVTPNPNLIPEPGILALVGIAAVGASVARRKRNG